MSDRCETCDRAECPLWATRLQYRAAREKAVEIARRERGDRHESDEYVAAVGECTRLWELLDESHPECTPVDWRQRAKDAEAELTAARETVARLETKYALSCGAGDALLAERRAICDALQIDNNADAANPAGIAMRLVAEVAAMRPVVEAADAFTPTNRFRIDTYPKSAPVRLYEAVEEYRTADAYLATLPKEPA
jgi:hypothetical protein